MAAPGLDPRDDTFWASPAPVAFANPRDPAAVSAAQAALAGGLPDEGAEGGRDTDGLVYFQTSGSSGHPKILGFTRSALLASAGAVNEFLGVTTRDVWLRVLPRFHVGGFGVEARAWSAGARCVSRDDAWDARVFADVCASESVTLVSLVPTQVFDLVRAGLTAPDAVRAVLVGGGELRPALYAGARALGWPVRAGYGLTEAASTVAVQADDEPDCTRLTVLPHWRADVDDQGILELQGAALPSLLGTWDAAAVRYRWKRFEPPLRTSDRVHLAGGTLVFRGRADRVVKRLGELIDLAQVDRVLADAAIAAGAFGKVRVTCEPDPRAGHRLVLECLDAATGAAVAARFDAVQPAFARIDEIRIVSDLRVSPLGKPLI